MVRNSLYAILINLLLMPLAEAQVHRYMVHFKDKANSPYSLELPSEFLSQRAIDRRTFQEIPVDESDFPVNPDYLQALRDQNATVFFTSRWFNAALIQADELVAAGIANLPMVEQVEFIAPGSRLTVGNTNIDTSGGDPVMGTNTNNRNTDLQNELIGINEMHELGYFGEDMMVAIMDGGFRNVNHSTFFSHLMDNNQIPMTYDLVHNELDVYSYSSHGTRVLSCLGARFEEDYMGSVPEADFLLYVTEDVDDEYRIEEYNLVIATEMADSAGVDVINASVGYNFFDSTSMDYTYEQMDGQSAVSTIGMSIAADKGIMVVVSAGNEGNSSEWPYVVAPADADNIVSVGASDLTGDKVSFSSIGPTPDGRIKPDVMAMGLSTVVCNDGANITVSNGTSFASPQVAGLVTGLWQANPEWTAEELRERLRVTASRGTNPDNENGHGIPDFKRATEFIVLGIEEELLSDLKVFPNPIKENQLILSSENGLLKNTEIELFNSLGQSIKSLENKSKATRVTLVLEDFQPGIYILRISSDNRSRSFQVLKF